MADVSPDIRAIFCEVLELNSADEVTQYLDNVCGDDVDLRLEVQALLTSHREAGNFLGGISPADSTIEHLPITERPGTVIGPYKLLQQIGEGGMGVVFMAEQTEPIQRTVALKIIKPGMDTRQVIARFEAERQALAMMDHPNIARVIDAGTTDTGRPYFVMDLVKGVPITHYCDQQHLSIHQRLELMAQVCHAVQHAHQKGIIHRDLKPSNVLVAEYDGRPVPKIIDFGVAKATAQRLTEKTMFTELGQMVGTVEYMSPEQARFNQLDVDTRSDVYSLGVLLYELLTGSTPFGRKRLNEAAFDEMLRIIREEEPPKPSTRLSSSDALPSIAANRHTEPARLSKDVHGELDWIVMKALEKDRNRRYDTANGLAEDIGNYLADEQVQACPPSVTYRFSKFARRNKVALATMAVVAASLVLGLVISIWQATLARRAEALAEVRLKNETEARQQATAEAAKATAISELLQKMLQSANPDAAKGINYTVRQMLEDFSVGLKDQLRDQPETEAAIHATIGNAYRRLGLLDKAEPHLDTALEIRRRLFGPTHVQVAQSLFDYAWNVSEHGDAAGGEALVRQALAIHQQLGLRNGATIEILSRLHLCLDAQLRYAECEEVAGQIMAMSREQPKQHPEEANTLHRLAGAALVQGNFVKAERLARESLNLHYKLHGGDHPETAYGASALARALQAQNRLDEAEAYFRDAITIFQKQYDEVPVFTLHGLVRVLALKGDQVGLDELRPLVTAKGFELDSVNWLRARFRGELCADLGDWEKAAASFARTSELTPDYESVILRAYYWHCLALTHLGFEDHSGYREACASLVDQYGRLKEPDCAYWAAWTCVLTPDSGVDAGRVIQLAEQPLLSHPDDPDYLTASGAALFRAGRFEEAQQRLAKAADMYSTFRGHVAGTASNAYLFLGMANHRLGENVQAQRWLEMAVRSDKNPAPPGRMHAASGPWHCRLTLHVLRQEADHVLGEKGLDR